MSLLVDGYIIHSFPLRNDASTYLCHLLKKSPETLMLREVRISPHNEYIVKTDRMGQYVLDYVMHTDNRFRGTVVPQYLWCPRTQAKKHVTDAQLLPPIFFTHDTGEIGVSVADAVAGVVPTLKGRHEEAPLGSKRTTYIHIGWACYPGWSNQIIIGAKPEPEGETKSFSREKLVKAVGGAVKRFLQDPNLVCEKYPGWSLASLDIQERSLYIVGIINVSAGAWQPILQLGYLNTNDDVRAA